MIHRTSVNKQFLLHKLGFKTVFLPKIVVEKSQFLLRLRLKFHKKEYFFR